MNWIFGIITCIALYLGICQLYSGIKRFPVWDIWGDDD